MGVGSLLASSGHTAPAGLVTQVTGLQLTSLPELHWAQWRWLGKDSGLQRPATPGAGRGWGNSVCWEETTRGGGLTEL